MRQRVAAVSSSFDDNEQSSSDNNDSNEKSKVSSNSKVAAYGVLTVILFVVFSKTLDGTIDTSYYSTPHQSTRNVPNFQSLENCSVSFRIPKGAKLDEPSKALFTPSFPTSVNDKIFRSIVGQFTGDPSHVKSYYAQRKKQFRHCQGTTTLMCSIIHPIVGLNPPPENPKHTNTFSSHIIYPIRNPMTALPAFFQDKQEKYHKQVGQIDEQEWRRVRDGGNLVNMLNDYERSIMAWFNVTTQASSYYDIAMYVPYEHLMEPDKGPQLVEELISVLQEDFPSLFPSTTSISPQDYECVWYNSVNSLLEQYHKTGYEYPDYTPSYTAGQLELFVQKLDHIIQQVESDSRLVEILEEYKQAALDPEEIDAIHA